MHRVINRYQMLFGSVEAVAARTEAHAASLPKLHSERQHFLFSLLSSTPALPLSPDCLPPATVVPDALPVRERCCRQATIESGLLRDVSAPARSLDRHRPAL